MRVLLIAESDKDLWKHQLYHERIREAFPDASVIIACGEQDRSKHRDDPAIAYFHAQEQRTESGEPSDGDIRESLHRQTLDYGIPSSLYTADRRYLLGTSTSRELGLEQARLVDWGRVLIDDLDPHAIFLTGGGNIFRSVFCALGNQRGTRTYRMIVSNFLNPHCEGTRIWFCTNNYCRLTTEPRDTFGHDETTCWQHIDALIESLEAPANKLDSYTRARRSGRTAFGVSMLAKCVARASVDCVSSIGRHRRLPLYNPGWSLLRSRWNYERNKRLSIEPESLQGSYIIFPVNIPLDAQITLRAPQYQDQISTCAMIANVLPHDCRLVIREHPGWPGMLDHGRLKRLLRRYENIRYISGDKPMQALLRNAAALITINSTSAVEAALRGIPVITLGESFYRGSGLGLDVEYLFDLQNVMSRVAAGAGQEDKAGLIRRLLFDLFLETFPGPRETASNDSYGGDGVELAAGGIVAKLESIAQSA